jgi:hypothetical protein
MSTPELVFLSVMLAIGLPALLLNRTAPALSVAALAISWCVQEAFWLVSGECIGTLGGLALDYGAILVIVAKPEIRDCSPYPTLWHQILSFWCERSIWDAAILAIFPLMWLVHASRLDPYHQYWSLWWLALVQFLLAGAEALGPPLRHGFVALHRLREKLPPGMSRVNEGYV